MPLRKFFLNRYLLAITLGVTLSALFLPGGYDALHFYLAPPHERLTVPAWTYLITGLFNFLPWPGGWMAILAMTIIASGVAAQAYSNRYWFLVLFSLPAVHTMWLGQIEFMAVAGLLIGWLVSERKIHPAWMGGAWLLLMVKPQIGLGGCLLLTYWLVKEQGWKAFGWACLPAASLFGLTFLLWPGWLSRFLGTVGEFVGNSAIWPYGLFAWVLALLPFKTSSKLQRLRMFTAATLLGSPYFTFYHATPLFVLVEKPWLIAASYFPLLIRWIFPAASWDWWFWVGPAIVLLVDGFQIVTREWNAKGRGEADSVVPVP